VPTEFDAARIVELLAALDRELQRRGVGGTIFIVDRAAMALAYNASRATDDIDGVPMPRDLILDAARAVASAEYVLAMKAMTSRQSVGDRDDAATLCRQLGITTEAQIGAVIARYFGTSTHFGAQELFFERILEVAARRG
jgi:hypothetical protein